MLKITSDGRKLGLDQRIINPAFPDDPESKVNLCVGNILQMWQDGETDKLTQLVFCDVSTPQATVKAKATALNPHSGIAKPFTVYEDIRSKLIAQGIPPEQIAFIHDANSEAKKKELFGKVRSGQVRVLLGSTAKMGAGTNVQDRLVAIHDLDCPWRPGDLAQRKGRIERQGNQNEKVHVFSSVTEGTFDAYLWQTVENKQKFISQIMSSKNPVRSCEDVDEVALSFAEIKALCAGDPRIKERMDLDVDVARLKIMKADYKTKQFRLEDSLIRSFPAEIAKMKEQIESLKADMQTLSEHPHPEGGFAGMTVLTDNLLERENAGAALMEAAKQATGLDAVEIGTYRGFAMSVTLENFGKKFVLTMQGKLRYQAELGSDPKGNLIRLDNALAQMPQRMQSLQVVNAFGVERTMYILTNTVQQKDHDGRISPSNKDWAKSMPIQKNPDAWGGDRNVYLIVNSHPGLTDLFVNAFRKELCRQQEKTVKPSVLDKLQKLPTKNSPKISAKCRGQER